jgi:hypothetical protein
LVSGRIKTGGVGGVMEIEIKKKARFMFLPRLIEIAREDRKELADMAEIGNSLGFDLDLTEKIERYLISENLISPSQHGGIISIDGRKVAWSSLGRVVTERRNETIFTVFEHEELKSELEKWAGEHGCQVTVGECLPDIVAIPFFVCVIDRTVLGKEAWDLYLEVRAVDDTDPDDVPFFKACIIVDSIRDKMALPEYDPVSCFDLRDKHSIQLIMKSIEIAKEIIDKG